MGPTSRAAIRTAPLSDQICCPYRVQSPAAGSVRGGTNALARGSRRLSIQAQPLYWLGGNVDGHVSDSLVGMAPSFPVGRLAGDLEECYGARGFFYSVLRSVAGSPGRREIEAAPAASGGAPLCDLAGFCDARTTPESDRAAHGVSTRITAPVAHANSRCFAGNDQSGSGREVSYYRSP